MSTDEFKPLNLLTFELLVEHRVDILIHRIYLVQYPAYISDQLSKHTSIQHTT